MFSLPTNPLPWLLRFSTNHSTEKHTYRHENAWPFISIDVHSSSQFLRLINRKSSVGWAACPRITLWVPAHSLGCFPTEKPCHLTLKFKLGQFSCFWLMSLFQVITQWGIMQQDGFRWQALAQHYLGILLIPASMPVDGLEECNIYSVWHLVLYLSHMFLAKINLNQ